jgi:GNAT superfamily N-acetyltransferase
MSDIRVREATQTDLQFLVDGNAAMALETEKLELDRMRLARGVSALLSDPGKGVYLVAECEGRRVGQMMLTYEWSDWRNGNFLWIQSVFVLPEYRGRGVFKAIYRHVEELARRDNSVCGLRLYVETENERAQETYSHCGMARASYLMYEVDFVIHR